ncbi:orotate phosphoribosyltransferase [Tepidiforma sp.]|uniref:orotate phosphoribosyltransferase n=1 Tax=Tepidiforma sp. TaxID=2682230 RepID=UPI002ADDADF4|nr:orotate phosphoribosyltransferase [Tepidiforma sp.]
METKPLTTDEARALLESRGALLRGHFQYSSGRHGEVYIEKFRILQWPDVTEPLCRLIAERFRGTANLVAGPTTGGVILAYETARQLGLRAIVAERREDGQPGREFRRGFEIGPGDRVLVVDDVLTTGGSIREVLAAVRERGAEVAGVGVLVDRTEGGVDFGVPFFACLSVPAESWDAAECRLCREGVPLTVT